MGLTLWVAPYYNMQYIDVTQRVHDVIVSCTTVRQLQVADKYCSMLIDRCQKLGYIVREVNLFNIREYIKTLVKFKYKTI